MPPTIDPSVCQWADSYYLIFSDNVFSNTIYYSHIFPAVLAAILGFFVWTSAPKKLPNILLFAITIFFGIWTYIDLVLWATEKPSFTLFFWSAQIYFDLLIYATSVYFSYVFLDKKDISFVKKLIIAIPFVPLFLFAHTHYNLIGFNFSNCDREALEGPLWQYVYFVELLFTLWIAVLFANRIRKATAREEKKQYLLLGIGISFFLLAFSWGNIIGNLSISWDLSQYGLFGMPIFLAFLAYLITKYQSLGIKVLAAQVLVTTSTLLVLAMLLIKKIEDVQIIAIITALILGVMGYMLVVGVKREVAQRERIEILAKDLELANSQQVTLIHFITHQIKGFVAKSRNIFSMALEGDFGPVGPELKPMLEEGFRSDTKGAGVIQEILNAANIKSGKVTFTMAPFDLRGLVEDMTKDLKAEADAKNLTLTLNLGDKPAMALGDRAQLVNVFKNLIDNSIKYTPKGEVTVSITPKPDQKKILFAIKDTGVGITPEDMKNLFTEGGHGKESVKVNVDSTGFGLYIVKNIVDAHKGRVWAESEGAGKGSQFYVELPSA